MVLSKLLTSMCCVVLPLALIASGCESGGEVKDQGAPKDAGTDSGVFLPLLPDGFAQIGSNGFSGANVPFGMITRGPNDPTGYSLTTLSGAEMAGRWQYYVPILPTDSAIEDTVNENVDKTNLGRPGYFKGQHVSSGGHEIGIELTATVRTGFGRFAFPGNSDSKILFYCTDARKNGANRISGSHDKYAGFKVYFAAQFQKPLSRFEAFDGGAAASFDTSRDPVLLMKVGMSYVSIENAMENLEAENSGWDFEAVRLDAERKWNDALSTIELNGAAEQERKLFYTYFYHVLHHPNIASDVNGEYPGFDGNVHTAESGRQHYSSYSIWDTYRGQTQLIALLFPGRSGDMMESLVLDAAQDGLNGGGGVMPRWVVASRESGVMETGSATPLIASAYAFGARDFDVESAWNAMERVETMNGLKNQGTVEHYRVGEFLSKGYVPYYDDYQGKQCASFTLEYSIGDYALAQFAKATGRTDRYDYFLSLSHNWKNLFNPESLYIQPRMPDGTWRAGFSPAAGHFQGFVEGTSSQYTWMIMHDWDALFQAMGGNEAVIGRLDHYFERLNDAYNVWDSEYHCAGNEPGFFTPWAYNAARAPAKTQKIVRRILTEQFDIKMPGADDLGAMGAWYVWASLGMYPIVPGTDELAIHGPRFPETVIRYADDTGRLFITGTGAGSDAPYIQKLTVNGSEYSHNRITLGEITRSSPGQMTFSLGSAESGWGVEP